MQEDSCTLFNSTKIQIRLSSAMSKFNYKYYGSSKENKVDIFENSQSKTRSIGSQARTTKQCYNVCVYIVWKSDLNMVITCKEQILSSYPDIFEGIGRFPGPLYHIQVNPNITLKQNPCQPVPIHLKEAFKKEIDKMLQAGIIKLVKEATPWINSFVLVEGKEKLGNPKLHICLDLMNLNKAVV